MNLYDQIMKIRSSAVDAHDEFPDQHSAYMAGHNDARHAAAELAKEANVVIDVASMHASMQAEQISEQQELIEQMAEVIRSARCCVKDGSAIAQRIDDALAAVREYSNG